MLLCRATIKKSSEKELQVFQFNLKTAPGNVFFVVIVFC